MLMPLSNETLDLSRAMFCLLDHLNTSINKILLPKFWQNYKICIITMFDRTKDFYYPPIITDKYIVLSK